MHAGARFLLRALTARELLRGGDGEAAAPARLVTSADVAWAVLSQCHVTILETFLASGARNDWPALRALGAGFWLPQGDPLRAALDAAAKVQFARSKDPQDCALLFVALGKKGQLQGLYKAMPACPRQVPCGLCHSSCCPSLLALPPQAPSCTTHSGRAAQPASRSEHNGTADGAAAMPRPNLPMLRRPARRRCAMRSCTPSWPTTSASRVGAPRRSRTPSRSSRSNSTSWRRRGQPV